MNNFDEENDDMEATTPPAASYYAAGTDLTFDPVTRKEEKSLFRKAHKGCEKSRTFLITNHLLFAMTYARKFGRGLPDDDLVSSANFALMTAIDRFDPARKNRFSSFLKPFIRGEIAGLWRSKNIVGSPRHTIPPTTVFMEDFSEEDNAGRESLDGSPALMKLLIDREDLVTDFPFEQLDQAPKLVFVWAAARRVLTDYEMEIFVALYQDGKSWRDVAEARGVSRKAVWAAHKRGMNKLRNEVKLRKLK